MLDINKDKNGFNWCTDKQRDNEFEKNACMLYKNMQKGGTKEKYKWFWAFVVKSTQNYFIIPI